MSSLGHDLSLRFVKLIDAVLITTPFAICWVFYYAGHIASPYYSKGNSLVILLFLVLYATYGRVYDAFLVSINRISEMVYSQALAALVSDGISYIVIWLLSKHLPNPLPMLGAFIFQILLSILWCVSAHNWYFYCFPAKLTAIIYDQREGMERLIGEYGLDKKFRVVATASAEECLSHDCAMLQGLDVVFLCGVHSHERNAILKMSIAYNVRVYVLPRIGDTIMSGAKPVHMFHLPILQVGRYNPSPEYLFIKRVFDVLCSGLALLITSPILLVTAIAIKATDGGPVFYKQLRLTKNGKSFYVLKFRSMRVDAEKDGVARLSTGDKDDRITPVGKIIRKCRIDELPQLINILKGEMSIIGPRPERPEIAEQYEETLPEFCLRLQAKAGLTGLAQVYGKYNTTPYDKLQMDLMYISNPSFIEDLRICFATVKILFMPESTEGISEGQTTAMSEENN